MSTMTAPVPVSVVSRNHKTANSYRNSAPIAVTLNLLWKATHKAKEYNKRPHMRLVGDKVDRIVEMFNHMHARTIAFDCKLKRASRFAPDKAEKELKTICEDFLALLAVSNFDPELHIRFNTVMAPIRQIVTGRLHRMETLARSAR